MVVTGAVGAVGFVVTGGVSAVDIVFEFCVSNPSFTFSSSSSSVEKKCRKTSLKNLHIFTDSLFLFPSYLSINEYNLASNSLSVGLFKSIKWNNSSSVNLFTLYSSLSSIIFCVYYHTSICLFIRFSNISDMNTTISKISLHL